MPYQWTPISGTWNTSPESLSQTSAIDITRCSTTVEFKSFAVSFKMKLLSHTDPHAGEAKFIFAAADQGEDYRVDFIYRPPGICRVTIGKAEIAFLVELVEGKTYAIKITLKDNLLSVSVDEMLIVRELNLGRRTDGSIAFGTWMGTAEFSEIDIRPFKLVNCFVVMPFDAKRNFLYDAVISPALQFHPRIEFDFKRADQSLTAGKISDEISDFIRTSQVVVADITEPNPNVYYELGFAHACSKKAILLIERPEHGDLELPFDIQDFRCHAYKFSKDGFEDIRQRLVAIMQGIVT